MTFKWIGLYVSSLIQSVIIVHVHTKSLKNVNMLSSAKKNIKLNLASPHSLVQFMLPEFVILVAFSISSCQDWITYNRKVTICVSERTELSLIIINQYEVIQPIDMYMYMNLSVMLHEFGNVAFLDPPNIVYLWPKRPKSIWFFSQGYCFLLVKMIIDKINININ